MRVLPLLACLAAMLAPVLAASAVLKVDAENFELVPVNELPALKSRAAVDNATKSCLTELGGLPKLLGVEAQALDTKLTLSWGRWFRIRCGRHWCWCRCWFWWCPWEWLHRQGYKEEARQVLGCTAKANNVVSRAKTLDVGVLEKSLLEKLAKLDDATKKTLGLDEEPVPKE